MYINQDKEMQEIKKLADKGYDLLQISSILNIPLPCLMSLAANIKISVTPRKDIYEKINKKI